MAANFIAARISWNRCNEYGRVAAILLLFLSVSRGLGVEETVAPSSQHHSGNISIQISDSIKETKTLGDVFSQKEISNFRKSAEIVPTELLLNSSYGEKSKTENPVKNSKARKIDLSKKKEKHLKTNTNDKTKLTESTLKSNVKHDYYDAIKPTKIVGGRKVRIEHTEIESSQYSGEARGVSMNHSRPRKLKKVTSFKRIRRGFGNYFEDDNENEKQTAADNQYDEHKKLEKNGIGKNYNQIAQNLEKIAKVRISNEQRQPNESVVASGNFRESREEENRKASPDIQDIITGIVNILNGKGTKPNESGNGRPPRPTSTRINNRGPPRISDVPPIDFDGPPAYRPLPPKRIPPPYPFDVPPSMPNIPLPPQPHKVGMSKLPSHPFIDGVPIPELVIPGRPTEKPLSDHVHLQYDTISVSEPLNEQNLHAIVKLNASKRPEVSQVTMDDLLVKNDTKFSLTNKTKNFATVTIKTNNTATNVTNSKTDINKAKPAGQKSPVTATSQNKNKRVRPTTSTESVEKPAREKTTTPTVPKDEKGKTSSTKTEIVTQKVYLSGGRLENAKLNETNRKPTKETKNKPEAESASKLPTSVSAVLSIRPDSQSPEWKTNITDTPAGLNVTTRIVIESTTQIVGPNGTNQVEFELPALLEPSDGIGEVAPVLESSIPDLSLHSQQSTTPTTALDSQRPTHSVVTETSHSYKARPGIVLDDPEYKPGTHKRPVLNSRPIVTAPPPHSYYGEIFDVTVHAVQGPGGENPSGKPYIIPVDIDGVQLGNSQVIRGDVSVITKPEEGQKFVSIDGKRTYINLFGEVPPTKISPTSTQSHNIGTGYVVPHKDIVQHQPTVSRPTISTSPPRRQYKRPTHPPVRIDTCIVGDDSTCDSAQNEMCRTEEGVSSCHCRPGYNRKKHRDTCRRVVSMLTSIRVDRLYDKKVKWQDNLRDPESEDYRQLSYEASQAVESAMSMTPFSDDFINSRINSIYAAKNLENNEPAVYVNVTIQLEENFDTLRPAVKQDIQRHLLRVIQRRNNNVGNSALWVDAPPGSVLALQDVDECSSAEFHDCHQRATCLNTFGSFRCQCPNGLRDPWVGNIHREGRFCESCPTDYCNNRGECKFEHGHQVCHCSGSFYGSQCEIDGEVLGVAIGASVAAAIIIILTLVCLCMWSRRWSREQKSAVGAGMGSPVFGYMATGPAVKTPSVGAPPYQVSIEDRIRWAQIADVMAKSNHYAQPEPVNPNTRPQFGGYPTLPSHTMNMPGTLPLPAIAPPVPLPRLTLTNKSVMGTYGAHSQLGSIHQSNHGIRSSMETTSSSEEEDRADLLGRNFNTSRPKSRASIANQSGIYYDVDFDRSDAYSKQNTIPMNTYTLNSQHQTRPYFR